MRRILVLTLVSLVSFVINLSAHAESKTLAATMDVYVFPKKGQDTEQQSKDEAECYAWAETNTDSDPFQLQKESGEIAVQAEKDKQQAAQTKSGGGMVRGAAAGAIIGEIADDDSSKGAAYGAAAGAISQRRKNRAAKAQAVAKAEESAANKQADNAEQMVKFKKAFSVCLEAKEYLVKY